MEGEGGRRRRVRRIRKKKGVFYAGSIKTFRKPTSLPSAGGLTCLFRSVIFSDYVWSESKRNIGKEGVENEEKRSEEKIALARGVDPICLELDACFWDPLRFSVAPLILLAPIFQTIHLRQTFHTQYNVGSISTFALVTEEIFA